MILIVFLFSLPCCEKPDTQKENEKIIVRMISSPEREIPTPEPPSVIDATFEELVSLAEEIVVAEYLDHTAALFSEETKAYDIRYRFRILNRIAGTYDGETILCSEARYYNQETDQIESYAQNTYKTGERYLLVLSSWFEEGIYTLTGSSLYLPLSDLSQSTMTNKDGKKESLFGADMTEEKLLHYIRSLKS